MKCEKLFKTIDSLNDEYIKFLVDICTIESPTEYKEGVDRVGEYFVNKANEKGWLVERQKQEISGDVVCITMNPDAKEAPVCFSGHSDTVHPIGLFGEKPVSIDDENIYGPGVLDCKGGLCASFMAMDALEKVGFTKRPVKLIIQSDEENGSRNSKKTTVQYMCEKAKDSICFLNTELAKENKMIIAMRGICKYRFEITGKPVHSSRCFKGVSAICEAAQKIIRLESYKDGNSITCNCGLISGGTAENTVPEKCTFTADFRFKTMDEQKEIAKAVEEIASTSFVEGSSCTYTLVSSRCSMPKTEKNIELFEKIKKIYSENGLGEFEMAEFLGGADSADLTNFGVPTLDGFGLLGGRIHQLGEFARLDSIAYAAKKLASVAYCIK